MRIDASHLAVSGFRWESPTGDGRTDHVALEPSGGVTGYYAFDRGHAVRADGERFEVASALVHLGAAALSVEARSQLDDAHFSLDVPEGDAPASFRVELRSASLAKVGYHDEGLALEVDEVRLEALVLEQSRTGATSFSAGRLLAKGVTVTAGTMTFALGDVSARDVSYQNGKLNVTEIGASGARFSVPLDAPSDAASTTASEPLDLPVLDRLDGDAQATLKVTAELPVVSDRSLSRTLRVPIAAGSLDYRELEKSLGAIGDALVDFEKVGEELVLELDIVPVVKFDNVTLVTWPLVEPVDRELADRQRVRLRRLLHYRLPESKPTAPKKKPVRLLGLDVEGIAVDLAVAGPTAFPLGGGTLRLDGIEKLSVRGALHVAIEGAPSPGALDVTASGVRLVLDDAKVDAITIDRATIAAELERCTIELRDATPTRIGGSFATLMVTGLVLAV